MDTERQPLGTRNGLSKLPLPGSRLKPPGQSLKRARSPDQGNDEVPDSGTGKKSRFDSEVCDPSPGDSSANSSMASVSSRSSSSSLLGTSRKPSTSQKPAAGRTAMTRSTSNLGLNKSSVLNTTRRAPPAPTRPAVQRKPVTAPRNTAASQPPPGRAGSTGTAASRPSAARPASAAGSTGGSKKRPAWDLKGRLQDMEAILNQRESTTSTLTKQLESYNERIAQLESQKQQLSGDVAKRSEMTEMVNKENRDLQRQLRECQEEMDIVRRKLQREIDDLTFTKSTLERQQATLEGELTAARTEISGLKSSVAELTSSQARVTAELDTTKLSLEQAFRDIRARDAEIQQLKDMLTEREATIEENNKKIREHETVRRKLHNTIQELKGNIRVFCRVRPLIGEELTLSDGVIHHMNFPDPDQRILELDRLSEMSMNESTLMNNRRGNNKYEFSFDRVFQPENSQAEVFEEISQLVQSALDGYNVCIFAYGQTGSGKTYTMEGAEDPETVGMIPRAVQQIFETAAELEDKGWQYEFRSSFIEIYNETIRDLLGNPKDDVKHEIKLTGKDNTVTVTNLTVVNVTNAQQVHKLLEKASHNRAVAETKCNERSSRSHSVFQLHLLGSNTITSESCQGTLSLVDLAGSERLKDSGSEGQRLKETQAINKSLSCLGNVIMALGNKDSYIPYRNSKLTYLLQNSLGGNSKTLMFVNVSPKEENFSETLNSLRFATKVNQCNIGTAQKRVK